MDRPFTTSAQPDGAAPSDAPRLSVVMSTYNRGRLLEGAIASVLDQRAPASPPFELIVVDNNSTDGTRGVVEQFMRRDQRVRYAFQPRQGLSHARNAGIAAARAALVAFTDDDVRAEPDWVAAVVRAFDEHPDAAAVGGRVLPVWPAPPPVWLTPDHWAPLALLDHGAASMTIDPQRPICLIGANFAVRRALFDEIGGFETGFQRVRDGIGSLEDHEFILRLLAAGRRALYDPRIVIHAEIQPNRLERSYHRRWHAGHGHFHALLRSEHMERTRLGAVLGVPAHLFRQAIGDLAGWLKAAVRRDPARAFLYEVRLRFFAGFFRTRIKERLRAETRRLPAGVNANGGTRMTIGGLASRFVRAARALDTRWHHFRTPGVRHVLFDARTAMEYGMMAPIHRRLMGDARVRTWLISSERPHRVREIYRDAPPDAPVLSPAAAMLRRFDAYLAADFVWATLPRGACRIQMFHGVAGKWSQMYDRPTSSMRQWDRLFFINRRRLQNYVTSGAIEGDSPAIRLIGMPKSDCLVDGTLTRAGVLEAHGMDPALKTVLYAPTWTRFSSLNAMGEEVVGRLIDAGYLVLVKLHENSLEPAAVINSGGIDWVERLTPILRRGHGHLIRSSDASPWLVAADVLITDHSSIGFEYLLLDRPLIRIAMPELIASANIGSEYVELIAGASTTVESAEAVAAAVAQALAHPSELSDARRALAADLFHGPGGATDRAVKEVYTLMKLDVPAAVPVQAGNVYA